MAAHIAWRFKVTSIGDPTTTIPEVSFSAGGVDVSTSTTNSGNTFFSITPTAGSAASAFNGNIQSSQIQLIITAPNSTPPFYFGVILDAAEDVDEYNVFSYDNGGSFGNLITGWDVEFSDDTSTGFDGIWTTGDTQTSQVWTATPEIKNFAVSGTGASLTITGPIIETLAITSWDVHLNSLDGTQHFKETTTGATYSFSSDLSNIPYVVTGIPTIDLVWTGSISVSAGQYVTSSTTPYIWVSGGAGTTGVAEPIWNLSGTTIDNDITWIYIDELPEPKSQGPLLPVLI